MAARFPELVSSAFYADRKRLHGGELILPQFSVVPEPLLSNIRLLWLRGCEAPE